ncbi:MAG TPA: acyl-CoA dehydrogenase family protein [Acidimicrobiales bacterium]|nr:acyl-CoA dehydrogenase family protein [Acidimicrobiales bacterium]
MPRIKAYLDSVADLAPLVAASADRADRDGRLADEVVDALHRAGLFRMLLAEDDGGGGLRLGDTFPVVEAMAYVDGAAGWNLAVGANALGVLASIPDPTARARLLGDRAVLVAGSFNPACLHARVVEGGVVVDGRMTFASGSPHATLLGALAAIDDGPPLIALLPTDAAEPVDSWNACGMRATGSHDWIVREVFVPDTHWFRATTIGSPEGDVMARLPLFALLGPSLAFVALGVARHACDLLIAVATSTAPFATQQLLGDRADVQIALAHASGLIDAGRALLTATWHDLETALLSGRSPDPSDFARLRLASVTTTHLAADATDHIQRVAGSSSVYERAGIARCWRDIHAVTQHAMVSHRHLDRIGRVLLGLPPGPGPI